jgi:hypothetical protein
MHGARSLVRLAQGRERRPWAWINALLPRRPFNIVVAAVANKLAQMIWAMLSRGEAYRGSLIDTLMIRLPLPTSTGCPGDLRRDDLPVGPGLAEPERTEELRARLDNREPTRGSHRGQMA